MNIKKAVITMRNTCI